MHPIETFSSLAWGMFAAMTAVLVFALVTRTGQAQSYRLSAREARVSLSRIRSGRLRRQRATPIPGRAGAWNTLIRTQDSNRLRAHLAGARTTRRLVSFSALVGIALMVAAGSSMVMIYQRAGKTGHLSGSSAVEFVGLYLIVLTSWIAIPTGTMWVASTIHRARMPVAWRLLSHDAAIEWLSRTAKAKGAGHERPREGVVSVATTQRLLRSIEAEILESTRVSRAMTSAEVGWRLNIARRVTRVLEAKARLLDEPSGEVRVERVFDWFDLVIDELVNTRASARTLARTVIAPELTESATYRRARRTLSLGFWASPAGLSMPLLGASAIIAWIGLTYPMLREATRAYPDASAIGWTTAGLVLTPVIAHLVAAAMKRTPLSDRGGQ